MFTRKSIAECVNHWVDNGCRPPQERGPSSTWAGDLSDGYFGSGFCLPLMALRIAAARTTLVRHGRIRLKNRCL
jgi:hypothetical protein